MHAAAEWRRSGLAALRSGNAEHGRRRRLSEPDSCGFTVTSSGAAGFTDADFRVKHLQGSDAVQLSVDDDRGFNFVLLHPDTLVVQAHDVFDTYGSSEDVAGMENFLNDLPYAGYEGYYMLVAVDDEGSEAMTADAFTALQSALGATLSTLCFRCPYAAISQLSSTYGGASTLLAEQLSSSSSDALSASWMQATCADYCGFAIVSAGYGNGNFAELYVHGNQLGYTCDRGFNFVVLDPTSHIVIEPSLSALPLSGAEPSLTHAILLPCDAMPSGLLPASAQPRKASVEAS